MNTVAEFATSLHGSVPGALPSQNRPRIVEARSELLTDIRAVVYDVYGTLVDYWRPEFGDPAAKRTTMLAAFSKTIQRFGMADHLQAMNPADPAEVTLHDFYHGLIDLKHDLARDKGAVFPEVKIEEIWHAILLMLMRHGYQPLLKDMSETDIARCMAYTYNFNVLRRGLFPGVADALAQLKERHFFNGIVSNAQFYTPIDLTLFLRDQSGDKVDDYLELFEDELIFYSYQYGNAKPGTVMIEKLYNILYELHILPRQVVFVGNDLIADVKLAQEAGMKSALFCGNDQSCFVHDSQGTIIPDICFSDWMELPQKLSFFEAQSAL